MGGFSPRRGAHHGRESPPEATTPLQHPAVGDRRAHRSAPRNIPYPLDLALEAAHDGHWLVRD